MGKQKKGNFEMNQYSRYFTLLALASSLTGCAGTPLPSIPTTIPTTVAVPSAVQTDIGDLEQIGDDSVQIYDSLP